MSSSGESWLVHIFHYLQSSLCEFFSAALNIRMELKIFRAGPSLMLIILTMSDWVISRNASPSICSSLNTLPCSSQPGKLRINSETSSVLHLETLLAGIPATLGRSLLCCSQRKGRPGICSFEDTTTG